MGRRLHRILADPRDRQQRDAGAHLLLLGACRGPHPVAVQAEEIAAHGTATFQAPRERVFRACVEALTASGYSIAREDPAQGVIVTERLQARSVP